MYHHRPGPANRRAAHQANTKRGGIHNSLTRILMKPNHIVGGYAQLSYFFNYIGPIGNNRDEVTIIRRRTAKVGCSTWVSRLASLAPRPPRGHRHAGDGADGDGDEPRQVHRVPHLLGHVQAGVDQPLPAPSTSGSTTSRPGPASATRGPTRTRRSGRAAGCASPTARSRCAPGGRLKKLARIFSNPKLPRCRTTTSRGPTTTRRCTARRRPTRSPSPGPSRCSPARTSSVEWSANWDDGLGRWTEHAARDVMIQGIEDKVELEFEQTFMFYLPRICEHCLNPSCAASCPSGAIYKRAEDGIVLVDQDRCRGWRMCVSEPVREGLLQPQDRQGREVHVLLPAGRGQDPDVCAETCVGRLRYIGLVLYDADRVLEAAASKTSRSCTRRSAAAPRSRGPRVQREAEGAGIPGDWVEAARRSPVWALINRYEVALPLHPSTAPCRWSGTSRRCRRWSTSCGTPVTTPKSAATCSPRSRRCGSR